MSAKTKYLVFWTALLPLLFISWKRLDNTSGFEMLLSVQPLPSPYVSDWEHDPSLSFLRIDKDDEVQYDVIVRVTLSEATRGEMISAESDGFEVPDGNWSVTINNADYFRWETFFINPAFDAEIEETNMLPAGIYTICAYVLDAATGLQLATICAGFQIILPAAPFIISPFQNEVVQTPNMAIQWTPVSWFTPVSYRLTISEVFENQSPEDALAINVPPFLQTIITDYPFYTLSPNDPPLAPGTTYACSVQALDEKGIPIGVNNGVSEAVGFRYTTSEQDNSCEIIEFKVYTEIWSFEGKKWVETENILTLNDIREGKKFQIRPWERILFKASPSHDYYNRIKGEMTYEVDWVRKKLPERADPISTPFIRDEWFDKNPGSLSGTGYWEFTKSSIGVVMQDYTDKNSKREVYYEGVYELTIYCDDDWDDYNDPKPRRGFLNGVSVIIEVREFPEPPPIASGQDQEVVVSPQGHGLLVRFNGDPVCPVEHPCCTLDITGYTYVNKWEAKHVSQSFDLSKSIEKLVESGYKEGVVTSPEDIPTLLWKKNYPLMVNDDEKYKKISETEALVSAKVYGTNFDMYTSLSRKWNMAKNKGDITFTAPISDFLHELPNNNCDAGALFEMTFKSEHGITAKFKGGNDDNIGIFGSAISRGSALSVAGNETRQRAFIQSSYPKDINKTPFIVVVSGENQPIMKLKPESGKFDGGVSGTRPSYDPFEGALILLSFVKDLSVWTSFTSAFLYLLDPPRTGKNSIRITTDENTDYQKINAKNYLRLEFKHRVSQGVGFTYLEHRKPVKNMNSLPFDPTSSPNDDLYLLYSEGIQLANVTTIAEYDVNIGIEFVGDQNLCPTSGKKMEIKLYDDPFPVLIGNPFRMRHNIGHFTCPDMGVGEKCQIFCDDVLREGETEYWKHCKSK